MWPQPCRVSVRHSGTVRRGRRTIRSRSAHASVTGTRMLSKPEKTAERIARFALS
jgi:hypothetical protein